VLDEILHELRAIRRELAGGNDRGDRAQHSGDGTATDEL
jgi:hypothetical protein